MGIAIANRKNPLRAKGTLISEPRFSTLCEMRFFPREKGKTAFFEGFSLKKAAFPFWRGKNRISQGVDNRGSLISVPLALRGFLRFRCAKTPDVPGFAPKLSPGHFSEEF